MKIENLTEGMIIKNYKELCTLLDIKNIKSTNSRNRQMIELNRYCEYHKEGHKIVIDSIRVLPLPPVPSKCSPYKTMVQSLILDMVAVADNNKIVMTETKLFYALAMVNDKFLNYSNKTKELSNRLSVHENTIDMFYSRHRSNFKSITVTALNSLSKDFIIDWHNEIYVKDLEGYHRPIEDDNIPILLRCKTDAMTVLGCRNIGEVIELKKYKDMVNLAVEFYNLETDSNIEYFYKVYVIHYNQDTSYIQIKHAEIQYTLQEDVKLAQRYELNEIIADNIEKSLLKRIEAKSCKQVEKDKMITTDIFLKDELIVL